MEADRKAYTECMPSRQKYWGELTADEKLERMRAEVKSLKVTVNSLNDFIQLLLDHSHGSNNKVVTTIDNATQHLRCKLADRSPRGDEVYF